MKNMQRLARALVLIGGLNWGVYGLLGVDLVASLLGAGTILAKAVYTLVGVSAAGLLLSGCCSECCSQSPSTESCCTSKKGGGCCH